MIPENKQKSAELVEILNKHGFANHEMSVGIIDFKNPNPEIFGYNLDHFIYPASVYKIFIGAEVLRQVEVGNFSLDQKVSIKAPNDVDKDARIFPGDERKLLNADDEVTIDYLLNLMLTRSDNTASNQLIDLVGRERITENIIEKYGWNGSGVTRKFLNRSNEDPKYRFSETTKTCARHTTEFMYLIETEQLVSHFVSRRLKEYMLQWNRGGRGGLSLSAYLLMYRKGGYLETNLYKNFYGKNRFAFDINLRNFFSLFKNIFTKGWAFICWQNDAAIITGEKSQYAISVFTITKSLNPQKRFPLQKLAQVVYDSMESNHN